MIRPRRDKVSSTAKKEKHEKETFRVVGCVENEDLKTKTENLRPCGLTRRSTGQRRPTGLKEDPPV